MKLLLPCSMLDKFYSGHSAWWTLRLYAQLLTIKPQKEGMYSHQWTCKAGQNPEIHLHSARSTFYQVGKAGCIQWKFICIQPNINMKGVKISSIQASVPSCESPQSFITCTLTLGNPNFTTSPTFFAYTLLVFWGKDMIVNNIKGVWVLISGASSPSIEHKWGGSASWRLKHVCALPAQHT